MAGQSKVGGIAAMVTVVGYVASTGALLWGTAITDGNGSGNDPVIVVVTWWVGGTLGTVAAAVALYAALRRSGGFGNALAKAAIVVAVLAALASTLLWAFFIWGLLLSLAMLLLALHLRKSGLGVPARDSHHSRPVRHSGRGDRRPRVGVHERFRDRNSPDGGGDGPARPVAAVHCRGGRGGRDGLIP